MKENEHSTIDSKYIQQHFANERTYLAWVRTCITIIGVGFLITNLHFSTLNHSLPITNLLANVIGLASIGVGLLTLILATTSYFVKGRDINLQTFRFSKRLVLFLSATILVIFLVFGLYYLYAWHY